MSHFQLYVSKEDTVRDIQNKFSEIFPHLQISVFRHTSDTDSVTKQDSLYTLETQMDHINPDIHTDKLEMDSHTTVITFESVFFNKFGLFVQVSRKNRDIEAEKFGIDHYTLDEVNRSHGLELPERKTIPFRDVPYGC